MVAASLFSGIGAPEQARPDWQWLWHAEIEPFPAAVLAARHPGSVNLGDVSADDFAERAERAGRPDVLVFGSPCQSFSVAGKRLGLSDPRGNLALVALRIIERLKPHYFVFENVPGLVSSDNGNDLRIFCDTVAEIGYYIDIDILDAQEFGLAQRRERVFAVCENADLGRQKRTHSFASASLNCLIEMCLGVLVGHIGRFEHDGLELEPIGPYSVAGLKTKTKLFGLPLSQRGTGQEATAAWQSWLLALDEILATCPSERANSGSDSARLSDELLNIAGGRSRDTETAASCSNTSPSWSVFLAALWRAVNRSTTSTATNQTTHQEIFTCSLIVLRICERITRLTPLPEHYSDVASSALIAMRVFIAYARQTNNDLFESLHCGNDWFAYIPEAERAAGQLERSLGDWRGPAAVLSLTEGLHGYPEKSREARKDIAATLTRGAESSGRGGYAGRRREDDVNLVAAPYAPPLTGNPYGDHESRESLLVSMCLNAHPSRRMDAESETLIAHTLRADGFDASEDGTGRGTPLVPVGAFNWQSGGDCRGLELRDTAMALQRQQIPAVASWDVMPTLCREPGGPGSQDWKQHAAVRQGSQVRRLSVIECARLQGFPDTYAHIITKRWRKISAEEARYLASHGLPVEERAGRWYTPVPADGPMYKAYGNSMAVPCLKWILTRIEQQDQAMREDSHAA